MTSQPPPSDTLRQAVLTDELSAGHDRPLVSVVITTHNRWPLLQEAMDSVRAQSFDDYELIVVDNGSTDETAALEDRPPKVRVVHQHDAERAVARNRGIAAARGEFIAFLDDDDLYEPWHLAEFAAARGRSPDGRAFATNLCLWDPATGRRRIRRGFDPDSLRDDALMGTVLVPQSLIVARSTLLEVGGFPEDPSVLTSEDWVLLVKLAQHVRIEPLTAASVVIREHGGRSVKGTRRMSDSREAATRLLLSDQDLVGQLGAESVTLVLAGTHRLVAAHLYGEGEMREARARLHDVRKLVGWRAGMHLTGRLWVLTWMGPRWSRQLRRMKNRMSWRRLDTSDHVAG